MCLHLPNPRPIIIHQPAYSVTLRFENISIHRETATRTMIKGRQFSPEAQKRYLLVLIIRLHDLHGHHERILILIRLIESDLLFHVSLYSLFCALFLRFEDLVFDLTKGASGVLAFYLAILFWEAGGDAVVFGEFRVWEGRVVGGGWSGGDVVQGVGLVYGTIGKTKVHCNHEWHIKSAINIVSELVFIRSLKFGYFQLTKLNLILITYDVFSALFA